MRLYLVKFFLCFLFLIPLSVYSQNKKKDREIVISGLNDAQEILRKIGLDYEVPIINYEPYKKPKFWKNGVLTEFGIQQISLTNWAAGGSGSVAMNAYLNAYNNYEKGNAFWENRGQFAYGFIHKFEEGYRKSDDRLIIDSKFGYRAFDKFYFSALFNFKTQFSPGFDYPKNSEPKMVSKFLNPGSLSFGIGLDYKPGKGKVLSINLSPLTTTWVIVTDSTLRVKYGNAIDEPIRFELGAQLKINFEKDLFKNFKVNSVLTLFSDYLKKPQNIQVNWDLQAVYQINKYFKTTLRTNLIYDDNVLIDRKSVV